MAQVSHRDQLLDGAIECLQTKGYARTTARDIAAASGANLASIGYHFGSKEALLNEALIRVLEQRNRHIGEITFRAGDASPLDRLTTTFVAVRELFEAHRPMLVAFVEALAQAERSPELHQQMAALYRDTREGAAAMLRAALGADADRRGPDSKVMASLLIAIFDGLLVQWLLDPAGTPRGEPLVATLAKWMALAADQGR
jgi:AcrR family transcriptional regulator